MNWYILISDSVHICQASVKVTGVTIMTNGKRATTGTAQRLDLASCRCRRYKVIDSKDNVALCVPNSRGDNFHNKRNRVITLAIYVRYCTNSVACIVEITSP